MSVQAIKHGPGCVSSSTKSPNGSTPGSISYKMRALHVCVCVCAELHKIKGRHGCVCPASSLYRQQLLACVCMLHKAVILLLIMKYFVLK